MDLQKITDVTQLKALAYDQLLLQEQAQTNLKLISQRLAELQKADDDNRKSAKK